VTIQPQPTPFSLGTDVVHGTNPAGLPVTLCMLRLDMLTGETVLFCTPEDMVRFGEQMVACGKGGGTGLIVPGAGGALPPIPVPGQPKSG
jgi:hypothetical protein